MIHFARHAICLRISLAIACLAALAGVSQDTNPAAANADSGTNFFYIVSPEKTLLRWMREAVMADADGNLPPGCPLASAAQAAAVSATNGLAESVSAAALAAAEEASQSLSSVSNDLSAGCVMAAISLAPLDPRNLSGAVVAEEVDGDCDVQTVRYSQALARPPVRRVRYIWPGQTNDVTFAWDSPWSTNALEHAGRCVRPAGLSGTNAPAGAAWLTRRVDRFGGAGGFGFGSAIVQVDGFFAFTGDVTNQTTGAVMRFQNGAFTKMISGTESE